MKVWRRPGGFRRAVVVNVAGAMATGTLTHLFRWPVKSMGGEALDAVEVDRRGVVGDRAHALIDEHEGAPRRLTVRQIPRMLHWSARYEDDPAGMPTLRRDGRELRWDDPGLPAALAADLGRPVALRSDPEQMQDLGCTVLVTTHATHAAIEAAIGRPLDIRRWRTNLHVDLDAEPYAEEEWEGRRLRVGEMELELLHPCERCVIPTRDPDTAEKLPELLRRLTRERAGRFGINARPIGAGRLGVGDAVELLDYRPASARRRPRRAKTYIRAASAAADAKASPTDCSAPDRKLRAAVRNAVAGLSPAAVWIHPCRSSRGT